VTTGPISLIGEVIEDTRLEPLLDRAYYRVVGPRRVRTSLGELTGTFDAWSSREYYGPEDLDGEARITKSFLSHLSSDDIAWDIGSHVGWHAVFMGQLAPTVAFEPNVRAFSKLHRNVCLNPESEVLPLCAGVSETEDERTVSMLPIEDGAGASISDHTGVRQQEGRSAVVLGGQNSHQLLSSPDAIKMDIQGAESKALKSLEETLGSVRVLMLEIHQGRLAGDWTVDGLDRYVQNTGFSVIDSNERRGDLLRVYKR
jgi:FkbM family methyltransferase